MTPDTQVALARLALSQVPVVIAGLKALFRRDHPDLPMPTDDEILATELHAFTSSLAKDEAWLAEHPANPTTEPD